MLIAPYCFVQTSPSLALVYVPAPPLSLGIHPQDLKNSLAISLKYASLRFK